MRGQPARAPARSRWWLAGILALTLPLVNPYVRGDGNGYYAYVRSVVIDRDLRFEDEYRRGDPAFVASVIGPDDRISPALDMGGGYVRNQWTVGPSLLWTAPFLLGHGIARVMRELGSAVALDGYSPPYRWSCALATALYCFVGLCLACAAAERVAGRYPALVATIAVWLASPLPVYMYFLPFHAHALAAFSVSLFIWYWLRTRARRSAWQWAAWGLTAGLMIEVYLLDAVCLLIAMLELARELVRTRSALRAAQHAAVFACGALVALVPHAIVKWMIHGSPFVTGYRDDFFWTSPRLWQVAFSPEHGLFSWTPLLVLAVVGLALLWYRDRWIAASAGLAFAAFFYAVASYQNWHGQSAFGNRFFVSLTPLFVLGLAQLLSSTSVLVARGRQLATAAVLGSLIAWNAGLMYQWGTGLVPSRGPVDFGVVLRNQVAVVPRSIAGFLGRYLADRTAVAREVERADLERLRAYAPRR